MRLAVVGFGLIGGSVALAARARRVVSHVVAIDRAEVASSPAALDAADEIIDSADDVRVRRSLAASDLVVVATPVGAIEANIGEILDVAEVVTDCGSTKRAILASASRSSRRGRFVPGHPMAGLPQGGIERASDDLFHGRPWLLCPEQSDPDAVARVEELVSGLGARPVRLSAEEHDRAVALTSHLPQLLASALAVLAERQHADIAAGPGFQSATRVAGGGEAMWHDILATNADEVSLALDALGAELESIARALRHRPPDLGPALQLLERARGLRERNERR
ncbi:MAG TPA: prephenate dehydrogenase/arogenate dehydrogenase family protein [Polyangiaceae bacterium]|nr:prephenate dehydrogenase/arogenate dehydrogenase family protein [Polyangiaceae bacterium]